MVLADDHEIFRAGLRTTLEAESDMTVIAEASDGRQALELCRRYDPDLVLMDIRMPEMDGLQTARAILRENRRARVVIMTVRESIENLLNALEAGAVAYLPKDASRRELIESLRRVLGGESLLEPKVRVRLRRVPALPEDHRTGTGADSGATAPVHSLTLRELEVLRLLSRGLTNRQIAAELLISISTVKVHVQKLLSKLEVSDRTHAAVRASELGILRADPEE